MNVEAYDVRYQAITSVLLYVSANSVAPSNEQRSVNSQTVGFTFSLFCYFQEGDCLIGRVFIAELDLRSAIYGSVDQLSKRLIKAIASFRVNLNCEGRVILSKILEVGVEIEIFQGVNDVPASCLSPYVDINEILSCHGRVTFQTQIEVELGLRAFLRGVYCVNQELAVRFWGD